MASPQVDSFSILWLSAFFEPGSLALQADTLPSEPPGKLSRLFPKTTVQKYQFIGT